GRGLHSAARPSGSRDGRVVVAGRGRSRRRHGADVGEGAAVGGRGVPRPDRRGQRRTRAGLAREHRFAVGAVGRRRAGTRPDRPCRPGRIDPRGESMKITRIEAIPFAIPYRKPLKFASGEVHAAEHVLVRVHTDDGVVGVAEAPPRPFTNGETQTGIITVIDRIFAPQLTGLSLLERETMHARMHRTVGNPAAKAAVDMAVWDALGRTLDTGVTELLGGYTDRMRVS